MGDDALLKAINVGLETAGPDVAASVAAVLHEHGMVLPPGITISAVYRVVRHGGPDGEQFTDCAEAERWARDGGTDGRPGRVEMAWQVRSGSVDVVTGWGARP